MTVRLIAFQETLRWIESNKTLPVPHPPEGMHKLAVEEWWAGYEAACAHAAKEDKILDRWTANTMWLIRIVVIFAATGIAKWIGNPYIMVGVGIACLIYLLRMK